MILPLQEYEDYRRRISRRPRNRGSAHELWVKHGTCAALPEALWSSPTGVETRGARGSEHVLGHGAHFATHAAFERKHAFHGPPAAGGPGGGAVRVSQLFLARLAAGTAEERANGDGKQPARGEVRHPSAGFDCVRGDVGGPGLSYALYDPYQHFPAYLVTYTSTGDCPESESGLPAGACGPVVLPL